MEEKSLTQKSLIEQILDKMISEIKEIEEFDEKIIQKLSQLIADGNFRNSSQIETVIKSSVEELK